MKKFFYLLPAALLMFTACAQEDLSEFIPQDQLQVQDFEPLGNELLERPEDLYQEEPSACKGECQSSAAKTYKAIGTDSEMKERDSKKTIDTYRTPDTWEGPTPEENLYQPTDEEIIG